MFVLSVITGPTRGQAIRLIQGGSITIGRGWECHIYFDDPSISEVHAEVCWNEEGFSVFDLSSETGTFVNGTRIQGRVGLRLGDHIQIGSFILQLKQADLADSRLVWQREQGALGGPALLPSGAGSRLLGAGGDQLLALDVAKTEMVQRGIMASSAEASGELLVVRGQTVMAPGLSAPGVRGDLTTQLAELRELVSSPDSQGSIVVLRRQDRFDPFPVVPITIGRDVMSGIALDDPAVSQRHALIDYRQGRYSIRDTGSSNGTFLNGKRVVEQKLVDGDVIGIGNHILLVVQGAQCLGLYLKPPSIAREEAAPAPDSPDDSRRFEVVSEPLSQVKESASEPKRARRRKKRAADLVWYATSDLDKGVFRARSAVVGLVLGCAATTWMLAKGDSEVLAGSKLSTVHEGDSFSSRAAAFDRDRCSACHVGAGRVSTLKCLDCHPDNRPSYEHADADLDCTGCHLEHQGASFRSAPSACLTCIVCHQTNPHDRLARFRPRLVAGFSIDARADASFHLRHQSNGVGCLTCHARAIAATPRGVRGACGQCHAPDHVRAEDCRLCHKAHPDRDRPVDLAIAAVVEPPRFAGKAALWAASLLFLSFVLAALIPRTRKVRIENPGGDPEK